MALVQFLFYFKNWQNRTSTTPPPAAEGRRQPHWENLDRPVFYPYTSKTRKVSAGGGVRPRRCLAGGGVSAQQTGVKALPCRNFVADGNE